MKRFTLLFLSLLFAQVALAAYTEFYCNTSTGSNLSAGSPITGGIYPKSYAGGTFVRGTGVFTPASGDPAADGVTVGDFASVYTTAGATIATFVGRITARDATTITVSTTAISGATSSVSETANASTCVVGGTWKGPNATASFPLGFVASTMTDSSGNTPRVNFKNNAQYDITAAMTHSPNGPIRFEGYTTTAGDGGTAVIDGGNPGASFALATFSGNNLDVVGFNFQNNGSAGTGTALGVNFSGSEIFFKRIIAHGIRGVGIDVNGSNVVGVEWETYGCNVANTSGVAGFRDNANSSCLYIRGYSHDNTGSNNNGIAGGAGSVFISTISETNGLRNWAFSNTNRVVLIGCDGYAAVNDNLNMSGASATLVYIENSNFTKGGTGGTGYGINSSGSSVRNGEIVNAGFGQGTQANATGNTNAIGSVNVTGTVTYATDATPYSAPSTGNFSITLATAKAAGRGTFTETDGSNTGTIAYPSVGAGQADASAQGQTSYSQ